MGCLFKYRITNPSNNRRVLAAKTINMIKFKNILSLIMVGYYGCASAQQSLPSPISETCGLTELKISFANAEFNQILVTLTAKSNSDSTASVLTFKARSFGYECRKNSLGWGGYVIFQTACPIRTGPHDPDEPCDFKNNFGVILGSTVLAVPSSKNGDIATQVFQYPSDKKAVRLAPVRVLFRSTE